VSVPNNTPNIDHESGTVTKVKFSPISFWGSLDFLPDTSNYPYFSGWTVGDPWPWQKDFNPSFDMVEIENLDSSLKPFVLNFEPKWDTVDDTNFEISEPSIADMIYSVADLVDHRESNSDSDDQQKMVKRIFIEVTGNATKILPGATNTEFQFSSEGIYTWSATYIPPEVEKTGAYGPGKRQGNALLKIATRFQPDRDTSSAYSSAATHPDFEYYNEYEDTDCFQAANPSDLPESRNIPSIFTIMKKTAEITSNYKGKYWNTATPQEDTTYSTLFSKKCRVPQQMKNTDNSIKESRCPIDLPGKYLEHVQSRNNNSPPGVTNEKTNLEMNSLEMNRSSLNISITYFFEKPTIASASPPESDITRLTYSNIRRGTNASSIASNPGNDNDLSDTLVADLVVETMKRDPADQEADFSATNRELYLAYFDPASDPASTVQKQLCFAPPCDALCFPDEINQFPLIKGADSEDDSEDSAPDDSVPTSPVTWKIFYNQFSEQFIDISDISETNSETNSNSDFQNNIDSSEISEKFQFPKFVTEMIYPMGDRNSDAWYSYYRAWNSADEASETVPLTNYFFFHPESDPQGNPFTIPEKESTKKVMKLRNPDPKTPNGKTPSLTPFPLNFFPIYNDSPNERHFTKEYHEVSYYSIAELIYSVAQRIPSDNSKGAELNINDKTLDRLSVEVRGEVTDDKIVGTDENPVFKTVREGLWTWSATYFLPRAVLDHLDSDKPDFYVERLSNPGKLAIATRFQPDRERYKPESLNPEKKGETEDGSKFIPDMEYYRLYDENECYLYNPDSDSHEKTVTPFTVMKMAEKLTYPGREKSEKSFDPDNASPDEYSGQLRKTQDVTYSAIFAEGWKGQRSKDRPTPEGLKRCMPKSEYTTDVETAVWHKNWTNIAIEGDDTCATAHERDVHYETYHYESDKPSCYDKLYLEEPWCGISLSPDYANYVEKYVNRYNVGDDLETDFLKIKRSNLEIVFTYFYESSYTKTSEFERSTRTTDNFERFTFKNIRQGSTDSPNVFGRQTQSSTLDGQTQSSTLDLSNRLVCDLDVELSDNSGSNSNADSTPNSGKWRPNSIWPPSELHLSYYRGPTPYDTQDDTRGFEFCYTDTCGSDYNQRPFYPRTQNSAATSTFHCEGCFDQKMKNLCLCEVTPCFNPHNAPNDLKTLDVFNTNLECAGDFSEEVFGNDNRDYFNSKCFCQEEWYSCCGIEQASSDEACSVPIGLDNKPIQIDCQKDWFGDPVKKHFQTQCEDQKAQDQNLAQGQGSA